MGSITAGIGLISGIDTASLIDSLIALESRPKFRLEQRVASLQAQQTAMLDINARLLNLKNLAASFRINQVFRQALATSSDEDVLAATAKASAQPGTYDFIIKRLVSTSQKMSRGYATTDSTPLGLDDLSFEFGKGTLARDVALSELNGGNGVRRGSIVITDRDGDSATVDLSDALTLDEVVDRINQESAIEITASLDGDRLLITDTSGGSGNLKVADASGSFTATDLGIVGDVAADTITGTDINYLSESTSLALLNDGNGVLIRDYVNDLRIRGNAGVGLADIDLGRIDADIDDNTLLSDLVDGAGVTISDDSDNPDLTFVGRDGTEYEVNLTGVTTVGALRQRVDSETGGAFTLDLLDGDHFRVNYSGSGGGAIKVIGSGTNDTATAEDLGILNEEGTVGASFQGEIVLNGNFDPRVSTIGELLDRVNSNATIAGKLQMQIAADGVGFEVVTLPGYEGTVITIEAGDAGGAGIATKTLEDLGFTENQFGTDQVGGDRLIAGLGSVLVSNLSGGQGLVGRGSVTLAGTTLLGELLRDAGITTNGNASSPDIFVQDRDGITYEVEVDGLTTVQDLIDAFNAATGGVVELSINGQALRAENFSNGGQNFQIQDLNGASVASELGIVADLNNPGGDIVDGIDTEPYGPVAATDIDITDRAGNSMSLSNIDTFDSLSEIIDAINAQAALDGVSITVGLNSAGNGLKVTDTSGGSQNLIIGGGAANALGLDTVAGGVADDEVRGSNLQLQYVDLGQSLGTLNYGRGIGTGSFRISDGLGQTATVNIGADSKTVFDIINEINSRGLAVVARVNDTGDGIVIEEDTAALGGESPFVKIKVESLSGTTAKDLNLIGEAESVEGGPTGGASIDGSYERVVDFSTTDTLEEVVDKINAAGIPVNATIINTGAPVNPYRLSFTSGISGARGEMIIDTGDVDLGVSTVNRGRDARVLFGSDPATAFLITSPTNTIENVVQGVTLDLLATSDDPVTLTIERDVDGMVDTVRDFVAAFNDAIGRIDAYDFFNVDTEERGVLLNNPTTSRVRAALIRTAQQSAEGIDSQYRLLRQVGVTIGANSQLELDEDELREAIENDLPAVEDLFAAFESTTGSTEEIEPGVTVFNPDEVATSRGVAEIFDDLLDDLTNAENGVLTLADDNFDDLIDLTNSRIEALDERLADRRTQLEREFAAMEAALARIQGQGQALASLAGNVALLQRSGNGFGF